MNLEFSEIKDCIILLLTIIGAYVAINNYIKGLKQRRLENTYKTLDFIRKHITKEEIETVILAYHANNVSRGLKPNEFFYDDGSKDTIETMFSEGGCGNGDIQNMIELFNTLCSTFKELDIQLIWYEYGQLIMFLFRWTEYLEQKKVMNGDGFYSELNLYIKNNFSEILNYQTKHYTYLE